MKLVNYIENVVRQPQKQNLNDLNVIESCTNIVIFTSKYLHINSTTQNLRNTRCCIVYFHQFDIFLKH